MHLEFPHNGQIHYQLKKPCNDGTTQVIFEPPDFIARLLAPVPRPRLNLTRYHGIFALHSQYRALATPVMGAAKSSHRAISKHSLSAGHQ